MGGDTRGWLGIFTSEAIQRSGDGVEVAAPGRRIAHGEESVGDGEGLSQAGEAGDLSRLISGDALVAGRGGATAAGNVLPSVHEGDAIADVHGRQLRLDGVLDVRNGV